MGTCKEKPSCSCKTDTVHLKAKQLKEHQPVFHTKKNKTKETTHIPHQKQTTPGKPRFPIRKPKRKPNMLRGNKKHWTVFARRLIQFSGLPKELLNPRPLETCFFVAPVFSSKVRYNLFQEVCGFWSETLVFLKLLLFLMENDSLSCEVVFSLSVGRYYLRFCTHSFGFLDLLLYIVTLS